jgi:hypothetical protein
LSIDERLAVISAQNAARLTVSPSDILNFIGKWKERQQILGRSTMTPEQFDAEVGMLMQGLQTMQGVLQNTFGEAANNPLGGNVSGADPTTGRAHQNNKKVLRDRIMNGEIKNYDEAVKKMTENGDMLSPVEQDLVKSWLVEAAKNARESKNGGQ